MARPLLEVKNLTVDFSGRPAPAIRDVSYTVEQGQVLCLVGESGSGKTVSTLTVMGLLPDVAKVTSGQALFDGVDLLTLDPESRRKLRGAQMGMIFQEPMTSLNPVFTVGDQVAEVLEVHTRLSPDERHKRVVELFDKVKIDDPERRYHAYPNQLSGGQRQRVMIAMALAMNPKLLIADEPTTALDVTVQGEIIKLIKDLQRAHNLAVLFITHDFGVVRELGTHVAVMQNGQIVEKGPMREVMANPQHAYTQKLLAAMPRLKTDTTPAPAKAPLLEVTGLRKTFMVKKGGFFSRRVPFEALKGVSFTVGAGEVVGLVGESGCGKSTLAKCLLRLYEPDGGTLRFAGEDVTHLKGQPLRALRRNMQMVFQDPFSSLNPRMRVGESVAEGLRAHNLMPPAERDVFVRDLLADCGLPPDAADRYPHQFSGGQRQRICIARALALKPKLIIADEPVSSLDVSVQKQILELMNQLKEKYGLSYLFISHDLRVVSQVCDRVLVMQRGEIVEQGPAAQVFQNPQHPYTKQLLAAIPGLAA